MISADVLPFYYFTTNEAGLLTDINETLCKDLGYSRNELLGRNLEAICTLATKIFFQTHLAPLLKIQGVASEIFITLQSSSGRPIPLLLNAKVLSAERLTSTAYVGIAVENRKVYEDKLIEARAHAEKALQENTALKQAHGELQQNHEKLDDQLTLTRLQNDELRQFNHVVTHELSEPVRKISLFIDIMLGTGIPVPEPHQRSLLGLVKSNTRLRSVVEGLQQYLWLSAPDGNIARIKTQKLIAEVLVQLQTEFPDHPLSVNCGDMPDIVGDPEQIRIVFYNILHNAVKYKKPQTAAQVRISSAVVPQNRYQITPGKYDYADYVKIDFEDQGIGFDTKYSEHIFELFTKLHPSESLGLGLALSKKIIANHQGKILAYSAVGMSTTITLFCRFGRNLLMDKEAANTILYIDDDLDDQNFLEIAVRKQSQDIAVVHANNGLEGLNYLSKAKVHRAAIPCLIILDLNMPVMGGRETYGKIKVDPDFGKIPLVIFTTSASPHDRSYFHSYGIKMITKPLEISRLGVIIKELLEHCE